MKDTNSIITIMAVTIILVYIFSYSLTLGTVTWVYAGEILTEKGMGVAVSIHWTSNILIYLLPSIYSLMKGSNGDLDQEYFSQFFFLYSGLSM